MEFLNGLTDDQTALLGCAVALTGCGLLLSISYFLGKLLRRAETAQNPPREPQTIRLPVPAVVATSAVETHRRAA